MSIVRLTIKPLIDARGWSIVDFQRRTELSYPTAFKLYHGNARRLDLDTLARIVDVLGVSIGDVLKIGAAQ